ncbi:glutathione S-transferase family protein [Cereibacter sphaeroides]|uniref:glutathione S-transferase family protein n=1 Tax=Cereibacter sphaeroides TaxID=1063 RepID=UPI00313BFA4D
MDRPGLTVTAFDWVPGFAQGQVRDLRPRWALEEVDLPYEVELLPQGAQETPEHLARQPFGQVPVLTLDGRSMFESGACVWRIAERSERLLPRDPGLRDSCLSWVIAALNTLEPPIMMMGMLWFFERWPDTFGLEDREAPGKVRGPARGMLDKRLAQFGRALAGRETIVGDGFTVADLMLTCVLLPAAQMDLLGAHPEVKAYYDRHSARPAFRKAQADQIAAFAENAGKYRAA